MKNLSHLGKVLNKMQQKQVLGGTPLTHECQPNCECDSHSDCANMPNPDYDPGCRTHNNCAPAFVQGSCVNSQCEV